MRARVNPGVRSNRRGRSRQPLRPVPASLPAMLVIGIIVAAMALLGMLNRESVLQFVNRPITKVRMENDWRRVNEEEMGRLLAAYMGSGFFSFDVAGVKQRLESHPWIERAAVKRVWPDSVSLTLHEQGAIARWGGNGVLNPQAEIFEPSEPEQLRTLPRLDGPAGSQVEVMQKYQKINELLFPYGLRLTALTRSERGSWTLMVNGQFEVAAGREKVIERLQRFLALYSTDATLRSAPIESVDLRYDNGLAVNFGSPEISHLANR